MQNNNKTILVTGCAGFIGSNFVPYFLEKYSNYNLVNIDLLTYAGDLENLKECEANPRYKFIKGDICNRELVEFIFSEYDIKGVIHFAAESHVDNSIKNPGVFVQTNVNGTYTLVDVAKKYWMEKPFTYKTEYQDCRFHHISTDEVYGDLDGTDDLFTETTSYAPSSPYSASKASSDHLVRAWHRTYNFPVIVTNCSNNYGPYHFPEKLIPLVILNALDGKPLPVYGKGNQIRDWLYVEDHARALYKVVTEGEIGETYNIGGHNEKQNIEVVKTICKILDELKPQANHEAYDKLITFVKDRPGHDLRYAIDASKIANELGWKPKETFETGIRKTVEWYLNNMEWCRRVQDGSYQRERLGVSV